MIDVRPVVAVPVSTFATLDMMFAYLASSEASPRLYPRRLNVSIEEDTSLIFWPSSCAMLVALAKNSSIWESVAPVTIFICVMESSISM